MKTLLFTFTLLCLFSFFSFGKTEKTKPRVIVTSDGEIDDKTSFMRFLLYSNEFNIEGLIYGNSKWQRHGHGVVWMQNMIDEYGKIRENLLLHMPGYPTSEELKSVVYAGNMDEKYLDYSGPLETDGSNHIISVLLDKNKEPVWIQAWGGTNTIAQALSILKRDYSEKEINDAIQKLWIFAIADQDKTSDWIRKEFPNVNIIRSFQFTALNYQHEGHPYSNHEIFSTDWTTTNIKENHGGYGKLYAQKYFSEGDSPAFFHLIGNGLRAEEHPTFGGWGGRFESKNGHHYFDAKDDGDQLKPQWRWLIDIQNDFAARMDWTIQDYNNANHPPIVKIDHELFISAKRGDKIELSAVGTYDPDGDTLSYEWFYYKEAGTFPVSSAHSGQALEIQYFDQQKAWFTVPNRRVMPSGTVTMHIILKVTDHGSPRLTRYKRIIVDVTE